MTVLSGWKEIANHLHQSVRTVQRWEELGLPVHRITGKTAGHVFAYVEELDVWQQAAPMRTFDVIRDLRIKVERLEAEVLALKRTNRKITRQLQGID